MNHFVSIKLPNTYKGIILYSDDKIFENKDLVFSTISCVKEFYCNKLESSNDLLLIYGININNELIPLCTYFAKEIKRA